MVREIEFRDFIGSKGRKINNKFLSFVRYGFELAANIPQGLWTRGYKSVINEMKSNGYNTIRLTFSNQMLRPESVVSGVNYALNADLVGLSPLQCMDKIINYCGMTGLRVILARYSAVTGNNFNEAYWYIIGDNFYNDLRFETTTC